MNNTDNQEVFIAPTKHGIVFNTIAVSAAMMALGLLAGNLLG